MEMINLKINDIDAQVPEGTTILQAARTVNIEIPSLCYLKDVNEAGDCRMCVVEIKGRRGFVASCVVPAEEGMEVSTNTPALRSSRKTTLELMLSTHKNECLSCVRADRCELRRLSQQYGVDQNHFTHEDKLFEIDKKSPYVVRDNNKCIVCRRCISACSKVQSVNAIGKLGRGYGIHIEPTFEKSLADVACVGCGQCIVACPVGALSVKRNIKQVWNAIEAPEKKVVFMMAPSIRATLGEGVHMPIGTNVEGKMVTAVKMLGVDMVFDMDVTADLTIMEEANELIERVTKGGVLPMMTSCCPAWVKFNEHFYPEMLPHLSTCKSPQQMFGSILKSYYCEKNNIEPENLFVVSVIPCTAKKFESKRPEFEHDGMSDIDVSLTTEELALMINGVGIHFPGLPDTKFDDPFEIGTGAGTIFGATGGVMEAALRTAAVMLDGSSKTDFNEVRGTAGVKEATYSIAGLDVKVAVASGLSNARALLEQVKSGEKEYHMIEVMSCPGGCINGGGQPSQSDSVKNYTDIKTLRAKVLYDEDEADQLRKSHESPVVRMLYDDYLGAPGQGKSHELLHTHYTQREKY